MKCIFGLAAGVAGVAGLAATGCANTESPYGYGMDLSRLQPSAHRTLVNMRAFQQTTDHTCGPAALLTWVRFHGGDGDEMRITRESGCNEDKGTDPKQMVDWLNANGYRASFAEGGTLEMIRENLSRGRPTLLEWIDWGGHWVFAVGYDTMGTDDPDDDILLFADPADTHDGCREGLTWFNAQRFKWMWFDAFLFGKPMRGLHIVIEPKEPRTK